MRLKQVGKESLNFHLFILSSAAQMYQIHVFLFHVFLIFFFKLYHFIVSMGQTFPLYGTELKANAVVMGGGGGGRGDDWDWN